jgi:hypothetical protein
MRLPFLYLARSGGAQVAHMEDVWSFSIAFLECGQVFGLIWVCSCLNSHNFGENDFIGTSWVSSAHQEFNNLVLYLNGLVFVSMLWSLDMTISISSSLTFPQTTKLIWGTQGWDTLFLKHWMSGSLWYFFLNFSMMISRKLLMVLSDALVKSWRWGFYTKGAIIFIFKKVVFL